jgi:NADPH-dependent curcumin reductase CurA
MASALEPRSGVNRQIVLAAKPVGMPQDSDFQLVEGQLPHPGAGEALVRTLYLSVDPRVRGRLTGQNTYAKGVQVGEVIVGDVVGTVVQSNDPRMVRGEIVEGMLGWQEYAVAPAKTLRKIDPQAFPITTALYALGVPGLTAYFGLLDVCRPQPGETVVVSAAAGAIGSFVGQIARFRRCRVIGIAGTNEKVQYLTGDLGFDAAFNYREAPDYYAKLRELCPNGIDVYFDNVGGEITDAVIRAINTRARVAVCGQISQYNTEEPQVGPRWLGQLVVKQAKVEGFLVSQFADRFDEGLKQISTWLREGRLHYREEIVDGLENAPQAFIGMMHGKNIGKELVRVARL